MSEGSKHLKRPRDLSQWAKQIVGIATGEVEDREPENDKDPTAAAMGTFPPTVHDAFVMSIRG